MDNILSKIKKKATNQEDDGALNAMLDRYFDTALSARKELDWKWFNYDLFVSGNHYARYDRNTQQILQNHRSDGRPKVVVNKTYSTLRSVRSYVLQNRPKAEVTPMNMTEQDLDQAVQLNQFLDYLHDRLYFRQKLRASMWHALKYSVGFWQVLYDEDADDGEGGVVVNVVDPYDLYWDPSARVPAEARYVVLAVRRNLADLKEDPKYKDADWSKVESDKSMAASTMKSKLMQYERGEYVQGMNNGKDGTVIVKEFWYKQTQEEEQELDSGIDGEDKNNGDENPKKGKKSKVNVTRIMLCTKVGDTIIRPAFDTKLKRFPFFRLSSDIEPLSMYGTGWVKNLIPLNRQLDRLESSTAEYNDVVNKGRYIGDKGAGIRVVTNEHGQLIEKKRGYEFAPVAVPPLSQESGNQITRFNSYIEDIGSSHDASLGRIPTGAKSGVAIEALMEGDSNNLSELTENTEEFLEDVYEYILEIAAEKMQFARNIVTVTNTGERQFLKIIGEGASNQDMVQQPGVTVIPKKSIVDVKIASYLAYSSQGRRDAIKDLAQTMLAQNQPLPPEYILEAYAIGPIADVVKQIKQTQAEQQQQQMQMQQQQAQQQMQMQNEGQQNQMANQLAQQQIQGQMQQQTQQGQQSAQLAGTPEAVAFIRTLLNGQKPPIPKNVGPDFINYLDHFMQSKEGQELGGAFLQILQTDRDQAMMQMRGNMGKIKIQFPAQA